MKLRLAAVRRRIDEVHSRFPDLSAQQIRDKLRNIAAKGRRTLEGNFCIVVLRPR